MGWVTSMITLRDIWSGQGLSARGRRALRLALMCGAVALAGCANASPERFVAARPKPSVATPMTPEAVSKVSRAAAAYEHDPQNASAALSYARALREFGSNDAAANILQRAVQDHPGNGELMAEYAKALTAAGQNQAALPVFASAEQLDKSDWSLLSAEGIALDQLGKHEQAREKYYDALKLSPNNPDVLCNLAFSFTLTGDLTQAEVILRKTVKDPDASAQARQNLAMVVGLQGRFTEAHALARADLDTATADHNVAVMRRIYGQPEMWSVASNEARGPSYASNAPTVATDASAGAPVVKAPAKAAAPSDAKPSDGVTGAVRPAVDTGTTAAPAKAAPEPAVEPAALKADLPSKAAPAVGAPKAAKPAAQHHAPPAVESDAANKPRQFADSNDIDETVFTFN